MKPKTDYRMSGRLNSLWIAAIVFIGISLYWHYQPQVGEAYSILALGLAGIHWVAYIVLKEISMMFDELKDKPKSDKEEKQLANLAEPERNIPPKTRIPLYTKVEIAGRLGKNVGREKEAK